MRVGTSSRQSDDDDIFLDVSVSPVVCVLGHIHSRLCCWGQCDAIFVAYVVNRVRLKTHPQGTEDHEMFVFLSLMS